MQGMREGTNATLLNTQAPSRGFFFSPRQTSINDDQDLSQLLSIAIGFLCFATISRQLKADQPRILPQRESQRCRLGQKFKAVLVWNLQPLSTANSLGGESGRDDIR